jgi:lipoprotein-releasing system permease protein
MALGFESFVALRYLRSKRKEAFISLITIISVLGVAVSVMVLNIVLAVMTGFEQELQAKLLDTSAHVIVRSYQRRLDDWREVKDKVATLPGVISISPYTYNQAMLTSSGVSHGLILQGIADTPAEREKLESKLEHGAKLDVLFNPEPIEVRRPDGVVDLVNLPPIIIGRSLRNRLGLDVGAAVTLLSPQVSASPQGLIPKLKRFRIAASYASGLVEYESGLAYTSVEAAQNFFSLGDSVTGLEVMLDDLNRAPHVAELVKQSLSRFPGIYEIVDWTIPNKPLWDALRLEKRVYFIVLLLLILVASFSIVSTLVMVVMEKTKDIAILKSMGASDSTVLKIFLLQGVIIGVTGTIFGTILGFLGCILLREYGFQLDEAVFSLKTVPVHLIPANFAIVAVAAFVITSIVGIYPARRAARLRPADSLRFE